MFTVAQIFEAVKPKQNLQANYVQPEELEVELYLYQQRTVQWMIQREHEAQCRGGILAEETGLGKTIELIALILDDVVGNELGTLIMCPAVIVEQWRQELTAHAPTLSVHTVTHNSTAAQYKQHDVVLVSYEFARREYYKLQPDNERSRRYDREYPRASSVLFTGFEDEWRRMICDEAQMVEQAYTMASMVTSFIRRQSTWASTGTPFGSSTNLIKDIHGMMHLLGTPYSVLDRLNETELFDMVVSRMIRNTKADVDDQIQIPVQHHHLHAVQFDDGERHYYNTLVRDMEQQLHLTAAATYEGDDRDDQSFHLWLTRLRQTCVHHQIGQHNKRMFGVHYKSIDDALLIMFEQSRSEMNSSLRTFKSLQVKLAMLLEKQHRWAEAIDMYQELIQFVCKKVVELQADLTKYLAAEAADARDNILDNDGDEDVGDESSFLQLARSRLSVWQLIKHQVLFCQASVYLHLYDKESGDEQYKAHSDKLFEDAEAVRALIQGPVEQRVKLAMDDVKQYQQQQEIDDPMRMIKELQLSKSRKLGGILSHNLYTVYSQLKAWLDEQIGLMLQYRAGALDAAFYDLHNEYGKDAAVQEIGHLYQDFYRDALNRRRMAISGAKVVTAHVNKTNETHRNIIGNTHENSKLPDDQMMNPDDENANLKHLLLQFRQVAARLDISKVEMAMVQQDLKLIQQDYKTQCKTLDALDQELPKLNRLWNKRVVFYRTLQKLSDQVALPTVDDLNQEVEAVTEQIDNASKAVDTHQAKLRYMTELMQNSDKNKTKQDEDDTCHICKDKLGAKILITPCAHYFDQDCLTPWLKAHRKCPMCTRRVMLSQVKLVNKNAVASAMENYASTASIHSDTYFPLPAKLPRIQNEFSSKVTLVLKHILYLQSMDPSVRCLLFSYWEDVLNVMSSALSQQDIKHLRYDSSLDKRQRDKAIETFKDNELYTVLLLNAKSQSAGLTLVQATHVFILEPAINNSQEMQAQARIHRLGQTRETHVHRYAVQDTIEHGIVELMNNGKLYDQRHNNVDLSVVQKLLRMEVQRLQDQPQLDTEAESQRLNMLHAATKRKL